MLLCTSSPLQDQVMLGPTAPPQLFIFLASLLTRGSQSCRITFFGSNSMEKILTLTRRRERSLVVAAVRIMRTIIGACRNVRNLLCPINKLSIASLRALYIQEKHYIIEILVLLRTTKSIGPS